MLSYDIIARKRDGGQNTEEEIKSLVTGFTRGAVDERQMSAWLMAAFIRGLDEEETFIMTKAMLDTGSVVDLTKISGPIVDKHSTGGVGDKVTLVAGPLAAAAGVKIPKLSGKALGHTGGTLDKLSSITGFRTSLYQEELINQVQNVGLAIAAQTADIVPADKKIYALRDLTATVESLSFIVSSIISKKAAGGAKNIIIDVKVGTGAFMPTMARARDLAGALTRTGARLGLTVKCIFTDMNQPIGRAVGNSLEVAEAIETLAGDGPEDLREVALAVAAEMVLAALRASDISRARERVEEALVSGEGLGVFKRMVEAQGGDVRLVDDPSRLPRAANSRALKAERAGFLAVKDCRKIGLAAATLIGHRGGSIAADIGAGLVLQAKHGDEVREGDDLVEIYFGAEDRRIEAEALLRQAIEIGPERPQLFPLVY